MKKRLISLSLALAAMGPMSLQAQEAPTLYGGLGESALRWSDKGDIFDGVRTTAVSGLVGYRAMRHLAIEAELGTGMSDDSASYNGLRINVENKEYYGIYLRPFIAVKDSIELYGKLGYVSAKLSAKLPGEAEAARKSDVSYGIGAALNLTRSLSVRAEVTQLFDQDDIKITATTIGIRSHF